VLSSRDEQLRGNKLLADKKGLTRGAVGRRAGTHRDPQGLTGELIVRSSGEESAAAQTHRRRGAVRAGSESSCQKSGRSGCRQEGSFQRKGSSPGYSEELGAPPLRRSRSSLDWECLFGRSRQHQVEEEEKLATPFLGSSFRLAVVGIGNVLGP